MSTSEGEAGATVESVTREEFAGLVSAVNELRDSLGELREAATPAERREAQGDVKDAKADLAAVARELGIDPRRLVKAAEEAKASDERAKLREIVTELLDEELLPEAVEGGDPKGEPKGEPEGEPKRDTEPTFSHWSERPLSSLFGGK